MAEIGHNKGPKIKKLTAQGKVDRVLEVFRMNDVSAAQKVIAATFVCMADEDGVTPEISADDLKKYAAVKNRKTVYAATQKLEDKKIVKPLREEGKSNRYLILDEAIDAALDDIDAATSTNKRQAQEQAAPANDITQQTVPVPEKGARQTAPVPTNGTGPVPTNGTGPVPAIGTLERESNTEREKGLPVVEVNCEAIYGPGFTLDFAAIDMAASLSGVPIERARQIAEICARDWAANGTKPASPMAMVKRAIAMDRNHKQADDARAERAAKDTPADKRARIRQFAQAEEEKIRSERQWKGRS